MNVMALSSYRSIIHHCFSQDPELIEKWHVKSGEGLSKCVDTTYDDMREAKVEFYVVYDKRDLVGYFGKERAAAGEFLTGFFILPKFRSREYVKKYWAAVLDKFGDKFFCGLYEHNAPAIAFIKRNGGEKHYEIMAAGKLAQFFRISKQKDETCQLAEH